MLARLHGKDVRHPEAYLPGALQCLAATLALKSFPFEFHEYQILGGRKPKRVTGSLNHVQYLMQNKVIRRS